MLSGKIQRGVLEGQVPVQKPSHQGDAGARLPLRPTDHRLQQGVAGNWFSGLSSVWMDPGLRVNRFTFILGVRKPKLHTHCNTSETIHY